LNSQPWWNGQSGLVATKVIDSTPIMLRKPRLYDAAWMESLIKKESKKIKDKQASKSELLQKIDTSAHALIKFAAQLKPAIDILIPQSPEYSIPYACLWILFKVGSYKYNTASTSAC
jgi:flavin-dependent dehydrogenase